MESQKKVLFGSLVVFALVTAGIMYWLLKFRSVEIANAPAGGEPTTAAEAAKPKAAPPAEASKTAEPPPAWTAKEISFTKSIQVEAKSIIVDGGDPQAIPCEAVPQLFGYVKVDAETTAELVCEDDYPGGIRLSIKDGSGDVRRIDLQQSSGDAGDMWDSRSLLTREKDGRLRIDIISVSSSDDVETEVEEDSCSLRESSLLWDPSTKSFLGANPSGLFNLKMFRSEIQISKLCLNDKGEYKR